MSMHGENFEINMDMMEKMVKEIFPDLLSGSGMLPSISIPMVLETMMNETPERAPYVIMKGGKVKYDPNFKFIYIGGVPCDRINHGGVVTIVTEVHPVDKMVRFGVSFCSPGDVFDKHKGKMLAVDRMISEDGCAVSFEKRNHHDIMLRVFAAMVALNVAPSWAKDLIIGELQSATYLV